MPNITRGLDILARQAGRVYERKVLTDQQRRMAMNMMLAEQASKSHIQQMKVREAFVERQHETRQQAVADKRAMQREEFKAQKAWELEQERIKAGKYEKGGRAGAALSLDKLSPEGAAMIRYSEAALGDLYDIWANPIAFDFLPDEQKAMVTKAMRENLKLQKLGWEMVLKPKYPKVYERLTAPEKTKTKAVGTNPFSQFGGKRKK